MNLLRNPKGAVLLNDEQANKLARHLVCSHLAIGDFQVEWDDLPELTEDGIRDINERIRLIGALNADPDGEHIWKAVR